MKHLQVRNLTRGTIVAEKAGLADNYFTRLRGLIGRRTLHAGEALIIRPCSSIHTFFMSFPIEVLFVDEGNRIVRATQAIAPWRIGPIVGSARYVVELPRGAVAASQTECGDVLELVNPEGDADIPEK